MLRTAMLVVAVVAGISAVGSSPAAAYDNPKGVVFKPSEQQRLERLYGANWRSIGTSLELAARRRGTRQASQYFRRYYTGKDGLPHNRIR